MAGNESRRFIGPAMHCDIEGCKRSRRQGYKICTMHSRRKARTGSVGEAAQRIESKRRIEPGMRFGQLVALRIVDGSLWLLKCDCGGSLTTTGSNLNRGKATKCNDNDAHFAPTYERAHHRVKVVRGRAKDYRCVDCGDIAQHWSFNNYSNPQGYKDDEARLYPFSMRPSDYDPRCIKCHSKFDNNQKLSQPAGASTIYKEK